MSPHPPRGLRALPAVLPATLAAIGLVAAGALAPIATAPAAAADAPQTAGTAIAQTQYALVGVDSESAPYPAPPALDGTALAAFDGDPSTQWASAYNGGSPDPLPHWITLDVGGSFPLTGIQYQVKNQSNGPVADVSVYVTDSAAVAKDPEADWGAPAATGRFRQPTSATDVQNLVFSQAVTGRYLKFVATSTINGSPNVSVGELRVFATGDTTPPPVTPDPPADAATPVAIGNGAGLTVQVAEEFPQVISYDLDGRTLGGQAQKLDGFSVNGTVHTATTTMSATSDTATYVSTFADLPELTITTTITATAKGTVEFAVTKLEGAAAMSVDQLAIPDLSLVSVDSSDPAAALARTLISTDSTTTADRFLAVTGATPVDARSVGTPYGFVSGSQLAGGILTNATEDAAQDSDTNWNTRLQSQIVDAGNGARRAQLSVGNWTYAPAGATDPRVAVYALPRATVVLAADANGDGRVDWQDAAIAYRDAETRPLGADRVPERVVQHIPFNFASQATNPFLKTLDNVKRISMTTDDLGQWVLDKGYANEGHDSGHPDYGGDYNTRAGGLDDFNTLVDEGKAYNADVAVHVNATEAYPQAKTFTDRMVQGQVNGWDWLNQSYHIDQRYDLGSGAIVDRFAQLKQEVPNLAGVYIDAYYSSGWLADGLAAQLRDLDLQVATEWAYKFEGTSIWSHWANDKNYGGATNKGINSNIVRFIANTDRDVWNVDPLLGGADVKEFEGWTGQNDWNTFYRNIWSANLPTKFLQHFPVQAWDFGRSATLADGVTVSMVDGERQIAMGGATVATGGTYLLPWGEPDADGVSSPAHADKMYYFNPNGGAATFTLTPQFAGTTDFTLYALTDQGRVKVSDVRADGGTVTLTGAKGTPYVLAPAGGAAPHAAADYGAGSGLVDPGFNAGDLSAWHPTGGAALATSANGDNVATLGSDRSSLSQTVTRLQAGERYTFSANVEIAEGERRATTVSVDAGTVSANTFDSTPAANSMASDAKQGTYSQRASVSFTAPASGTVTVALGAVPGDAVVTLDDARLMRDTSTPSPASGAVIAADDFEGNQPGWGPFVKGDAGGTTDPRTSISERHAPYSQKEWKNTHSPYDAGALNGLAVDDVLTGEHSLKAHEENTGLVYRTVPATVPFVAGHKYRVSFDYQTNLEGQWAWVTGADTLAAGSVSSADVNRDALAPALDTAHYAKEVVAGCGDTWVGLRKLSGANGADFVLDDFRVEDLGEEAGGASCGSVTAPASTDLSPGVAGTFVTTFTNNELTAATNVGVRLTDLPDGWTAEVATKNGNLFDRVAPGASVSTTWLVTPPASAGGTTAMLGIETTYVNDCVTKSVSAQAKTVVSERPMLSPGSMTATADSENLSSGAGEGPVGNVLDGDPDTIWHTDYTNSAAPYPHWVTLALAGPSTVDGFGYLGRSSGGQNGRVKGYEVAVSDDGSTWTTVASGALVDSPSMQVIPFAPTTASFVRFTALSALNGQAFAAAAEMRVYGAAADAPTGYAPGARPDDEPCASGTPAIAAPAAVTAGHDLTVGLSGFSAGVRATVVLHSDPLTLGQATTDADGAASVTATVPADFATGPHTIQVVVDGAVVAERAIVVTAAEIPGAGGGSGGGAVVPPGLDRPLASTGSGALGAALLALLAAGGIAAGAALRLRARRRRP
ncbi:endo-alpha-N-acetylgalactosaminidase family protein [Leifsonia sp. LS1]|uniref:endo-alpha-N-acetylgalactosaminidase family protein n=1 Tax=Leifsonia sp. LS1 TaxID=2828483 RepID=UPI001CFC90E5|nr:endo-alpha-N-acetylgalactosaminidase family protein [Leifsonia sp. LS1]